MNKHSFLKSSFIIFLLFISLSTQGQNEFILDKKGLKPKIAIVQFESENNRDVYSQIVKWIDQNEKSLSIENVQKEEGNSINRSN